MRNSPNRTQALFDTYPIGEENSSSSIIEPPVVVRFISHELNNDSTGSVTTYEIQSKRSKEVIQVTHSKIDDAYAFQTKGNMYNFDGIVLNGPQVVRLSLPVVAGNPAKVDTVFVYERRALLGPLAWNDILSLRANPILPETLFQDDL